MRSTLAKLLACLPLLATSGLAEEAGSGLRGTPEAVAAARQLVEQAGGAEAWRNRRFEVTERIYPASGNAATVRIVRDFEASSRLMVATTAKGTRTEWISPTEGWTRRDDARTANTPEQNAAESQGLAQEPYAIYHRIAKDDPELRFELRDGSNLYVFDRGERLLCWFLRAPNGTLLGWANFYDGAINQHYYGPLVDVGPARLPKFGVAGNGSYRFEYLSAAFSNDPLEAPLP